MSDTEATPPAAMVPVPELVKPTLKIHTTPAAHTKVLEYPPLPSIFHAGRDKAIQLAHQHITERGANRGPMIEKSQSLMGGQPGDSWCADFWSYTVMWGFAGLMGWGQTVSDMIQHIGLFGKLYFSLSGYCPSLWHAMQSRGLTRDRNYMGDSADVVFYDFHQIGESHHVEWLLQTNHDDTIKTIGGNTSSGLGNGSQDDGDGIWVRVRTKYRVFGYGHPHRRA